jgi:hypothetical protein
MALDARITASTGASTCPSRSCRIWRATWARRRCGSATARQPSCSSTRRVAQRGPRHLVRARMGAGEGPDRRERLRLVRGVQARPLRQPGSTATPCRRCGGWTCPGGRAPRPCGASTPRRSSPPSTRRRAAGRHADCARRCSEITSSARTAASIPTVAQAGDSPATMKTPRHAPAATTLSRLSSPTSRKPKATWPPR